MDELNRQVRRARRRLGLRRFAAVLGWCWFAGLVIALGLIVAARVYPLGVGDGIWAAAALGVGLATAGVWMVLTRRGMLGAALEIDRRFALKERVSSTLAMPPADRDTEAGRALAADAGRRLGRVDVATRFSATPPRHCLLPLIPAMIVVTLMLTTDPAVPAAPVAEEEQEDDPTPVVKPGDKPDPLRRRLADRQKQAEEMGLKDVDELLKKLQQGAENPPRDKAERKKALAGLNDLARKVQARREQLGGADKLKEQLNQLKQVKAGPATDLAKAVAKGDFQKAADEIEKLKEQMTDSKLSDDQKQALSEQLQQMQQKFNDLANAHKNTRNGLQDQLDQLRDAGDTAQSEKVLDQLDKMLQQAPQMDQLSDLADKLGECCQQLRSGESGKAAQSMAGMQQSMQDLQQQLDELDLLNGAMDDLADARQRMNCPSCSGTGCGQCEGGGSGSGSGNQPGGQPGGGMAGNQLGQGGDGMGPGEGGHGDRGEAEDKVGFYDSQVRQHLNEDGVFVLTGIADGPNRKGVAEAAIQQQFDATLRGETDPLAERHLPRNVREHAKEYFDRAREDE